MLASLTGGFFGSQIPEDAQAAIEHATAALKAQIRARAQQQKGMRYTFEREGIRLTVKARGISAHSSQPEDGLNAISMLAAALNVQMYTAVLIELAKSAGELASNAAARPFAR